jgi:RND family efflux transporter MFP subunit
VSYDSVVSDLTSDLAALRIERPPYRPGMGRSLRWAVLLAVLAGVGVGAWKFIARPRPVEVQVVTVAARAAGTQATVLNASGYVTARRRATVSSKITGKVVEVNVEEGMAVKEGQVLARLDDSTPKAMLALAEAQVEAARRAVTENSTRLVDATMTLSRRQQLLVSRVAAQAEVDSAATDVRVIEARIAALEQQVEVAERQIALQRTDLDNAIIRAPFGGIAISKDAQPGEMVSPISAGGGFTRTGICTIVDMKSLEIEVNVNEAYINRVKPGQKVTAVLDSYPEWPIPAHVITMVPTADRQKATVLVRIGFEQLDPRILPDLSVKVTFLRDETPVPGVGRAAEPGATTQAIVLVPKPAVRTEGASAFAFVVHNGVVERRAVSVRGTDGDRLEVAAGLTPGDQVVASAPADLQDGASVVVK